MNKHQNFLKFFFGGALIGTGISSVFVSHWQLVTLTVGIEAGLYFILSGILEIAYE